MRNKASGTPLFHIFELGRLAHVLLVRHDFHNLRESRLIAVRVLFARLSLFLGQLLRGLPNAGYVAHSLIPFFLLSRNLVDLL